MSAVIRFLHAEKLPTVEIYRQLSEIYGEASISVQHICKWCPEFSEEHTNIHDEQRNGRPSISDEVVAKIESILLEHWRITIRKLAALVPEVCEKSIDKILTERLCYRMMCA